mgnify:CR=1 FL=1
MNQIIGIMSKALDASALRQKSISNNIANVDTPDYKPTRVVFEELLQQEVNHTFVSKRTNGKHIPFGGTGGNPPTPRLVTETPTYHNNGNGVDLDYEMTEMSKNTLLYQSLTYGINEQFNLLKTTIRGRG